jgi:hypothetical protein
MKKQIFFALFTAFIALLLTNCASLSGLQDGRTAGQGNGELGISLNLATSPDFNTIEDEGGLDTVVNVEIPSLFVPALEFGGRMGVGEKIDIGLRLNTSLNLGFNVKAQVLGDRESKTALSLGAEVGTFGLVLGLWNVQVPVYFSVHPKENFTWYVTPRYIYQFATVAGIENGLSYLGGNTGILFGKRNKFGLDLGYYSLGADGSRLGLINIGLGGRFALGKN